MRIFKNFSLFILLISSFPFTSTFSMEGNTAIDKAIKNVSFNKNICESTKRDLRNIQIAQFETKGSGKFRNKNYFSLRKKHDQRLAEILLLRGLKEIKNEYKGIISSRPLEKASDLKTNFLDIKNSIKKRLATTKKIMAIEMILKSDIDAIKNGTYKIPKDFKDSLEKKCKEDKLTSSLNKICDFMNIKIMGDEKFNKVLEVEDTPYIKESEISTYNEIIVSGFYNIYNRSKDGKTQSEISKDSKTFLKELMHGLSATNDDLDNLYELTIKDQNQVKDEYEKMIDDISNIEAQLAKNKESTIEGQESQIERLYEKMSSLQDSLSEKTQLPLEELKKIALMVIPEKSMINQKGPRNIKSRLKEGQKKLTAKFHRYSEYLARRLPKHQNLEYFKQQVTPRNQVTSTKEQFTDSIKSTLSKYLKGTCDGLANKDNKLTSDEISKCLSGINNQTLNSLIKERDDERKKLAKQIDSIKASDPYKGLNALKHYAASEYQYHCETKPKVMNFNDFYIPTCNQNSMGHSRELKLFLDNSKNLLAEINYQIKHHNPKNLTSLRAYEEICKLSASKITNDAASLRAYSPTKSICKKIARKLGYKKTLKEREENNAKSKKFREKYEVYGNGYGRQIIRKKGSIFPAVATHFASSFMQPFQTYLGYNHLNNSLPNTVNYLQSVKTANAFKNKYYGGLDPFAFNTQSLLFSSGQRYDFSNVDIGDTQQYLDNDFNPGSVEISNN